LGSPSDAEKDIALVQRIQAGDSSAFNIMVIQYQSLVTGLLYRFSSQPADLEDLVQEAFIKLWRGIPSWKPDRPFVHWLKRVTVRVGLEYCRRQKRSPLAQTLPHQEGETDPLINLPCDSSLNNDLARESLEQAQFLLSTLPPDDRALLTLLYLNEMPLNEVADHFGWSKANAKIKAFRARNRLRNTLKQYGYRYKK